jgi:tRNA threonylcarbamoyladenosine dehydratase
MNDLYQNIIHRSEMVLGTSAMEKLSRTRVIIFGVGGVGSWCAESLVRTGLNNLTIVDSDIICPTNINRQVQATSLNIGKSKVEELAVRLRSINPGAEITALHAAYDEASYSEFKLSSYDFVIDAIDSLRNKVSLLEQCVAGGITVYSSMGAGARNDPSRIKIDLIANTKNCPLARRVRKMLRDRNVFADILCVYSDEIPVDPAVETLCGTGDCACVYDRDNFCEENESGAVDWCSMKRQINGALVHITAIFGFMLAGLVIESIAKGKKG